MALPTRRPTEFANDVRHPTYPESIGMPIYSILHRWTRSTIAVIEAPTYARALEWATRRGMSLIDVDLEGLVLRSAFLARADLRGAGLGGADLAACYLRKADLRAADLREARLVHAFMGGADLRRRTSVKPIYPIPTSEGPSLSVPTCGAQSSPELDSPVRSATGVGASSRPSCSVNNRAPREETLDWLSIWPSTRTRDLGDGSSSSPDMVGGSIGPSPRWRNRCVMATTPRNCCDLWQRMRRRTPPRFPSQGLRPGRMASASSTWISTRRRRRILCRPPECCGHAVVLLPSAPPGPRRRPNRRGRRWDSAPSPPNGPRCSPHE